MTDETKSSDETATTLKAGKKKIGISKTAPKNEARPLGTPAPKRLHSKKKPSSEAQTITSADVAEVRADELVGSGAKKVVDTPASARVDSSSSNTETSNTATSIGNTGDVAHTVEEDKKIMSSIVITPDTKTRKSTSLVFAIPTGMRGSVRAAKTIFPNGKPVEGATYSLVCDQENGFATPKPKLTAEQRKEARKNAPKLSPAQKLAKLQERAAKLQAKIAAEATPAAAGATA